jgi:hypothetical protein
MRVLDVVNTWSLDGSGCGYVEGVNYTGFVDGVCSMVVFLWTTRVFKQIHFYVIYYILRSGGFTT